jgi:hypothetical protein
MPDSLADMTTASPLQGPALAAARDAVYWQVLLPACERVSSGRPPEEDPQLPDLLTAALLLQRKLGFPGSPEWPVGLTLNELEVVSKAARAWGAGVLERVRDGEAHPLPDGSSSAPRSREDLRRVDILYAHLAKLLGLRH